jgi:hypothetical protein
MTQNGKETGGNDPQIGWIPHFLCHPNPDPPFGKIQREHQISPSMPKDSTYIGGSDVTTPLFANIDPLKPP